jgi:hypothetical protein
MYAITDKEYPYARAPGLLQDQAGTMLMVRNTLHSDFADVPFWAPLLIQKLGVVGAVERAACHAAYTGIAGRFADVHSGSRNGEASGSKDTAQVALRGPGWEQRLAVDDGAVGRLEKLVQGLDIVVVDQLSDIAF